MEPEIRSEYPQWFAVSKWAAEDVVTVAEEQGIVLTEEQAVAWWKKNEDAFLNSLIEYDMALLHHVNFEKR